MRKKLLNGIPVAFLLAVGLSGLVLCACDRGGNMPHDHVADSRQIVTLPTCTEEGRAIGNCVICGEDMEMILPTVAHTYTETVILPTCEVRGYTRYACACGYSYEGKYTPSTGHTFAEQVIPPTCDTQGYTRYVCACGYSYEGKYTPPIGHTLTEQVVLPTCDAQGYTHYSCACGYSYEGKYTPPTGHTFTGTVIPPTCDTQGYTRYTCACGFSYDGGVTPPMGHTLTETVTVPPTCDVQGYTRYLCDTCGHEENGNILPSTGHVNISSERVYPTLDHDGFTRHTCLDCNYMYEDSYIRYQDIVSGAYVENTEILMQGIDTSKWNHEYGASLEDIKPLDFIALKEAGVDFVILKAGSSIGIDPAFELDYRDAKAAGLQVGAYFYTYSTTPEDTLADAERLISWLEGKQFELPIYFDMEETSMMELGGELLTEMCRVFVTRLQEEGYYAALYTNTEWLYNLLDTEWVKNNLDVWYARYTMSLPAGKDGFTVEDTNFPWKDGTTYRPGETDKRFGLWQYTDSGTVDGFRYRFDFNYAFKDYKSIMMEWGLNGFSAVT